MDWSSFIMMTVPAHRKQPGNYYKPSKDIFKVTAMRPTTSLRVRKRCALSDALPT
jgi:Transposase IS66 family.